MACNDAEITPYDKSKTECNEAFDFAQWIESNELLPVKSLMIKHNLNTTAALSLTSPQYIQLLSDPALFQTKSNFISKIHKAIQSLTDANRSQSLDDFIVISEAERSVMDKLKQYIIELDKIEKNMKQLKEKYPQSIQRIYTERDSQIERAQKKINDTFNSIKDELNKRQQDLLDELIKMKEGNISMDDMKEIELFDEVEKAVKIQKTKIDNNLKLCNDTVITQKNKEREKRKQFILNIGQKCDKECNIQIQNMVTNKQKVQELITKNNEYCVNIACNINQAKYKDLLKSIHNLGVIADEHKEITQVITDDSTVFAITDDPFEEKDNKSNSLKVTKKQLYNIVNEWQQKYENQINTFNVDTSNKWELFQNKYTYLMNSIERCKQKYDTLAVSNSNLQKQNHNQSQEILKWQTQYNNFIETVEPLKWHETQNKLEAKCNDFEKSCTKWQSKYNTILKSLKFSGNSKFRLCKEEKEQYIPVKELDKKQKTYVSSKGMMKTVNEVCCQMPNTVDVTQISKWIAVFRDTYEFATNSTDWTFDHWDSQLKHDHIYQDDNVVTADSIWFRSVFASKICKSPFKYHWKLEQQTVSPADFYVGIEQVGKELIDTYFYKSSTSYAFSGHNAILYSNGQLTSVNYGKCCSKKGDIIDVYLDLQSNVLSYGVNGKKYKAYKVKAGEYRLAVSINGSSRIKLVYSTKRN